MDKDKTDCMAAQGTLISKCDFSTNYTGFNQCVLLGTEGFSFNVYNVRNPEIYFYSE